jgi:glycosyltransferase involved in cell wall biosynthesis
LLLTDLVEAASMRRAVTRALRDVRPRAIIYSTPQSTMLQPHARLDGATALRFDALTRVNRPGWPYRLLHLLERRSLRHVSMLLPHGLDPTRRVDGDEAERAVALPLPIERRADAPEREPIALSYAADPEKKGLATIVRAWGAAAPEGHRLLVTGIDERAGAAFLRRRNVAEPAGIEWAGLVPAERYGDLSSSAAIYLAASRFEEYGLAQLEALAGGALLVTTASPGPYEALSLARELDPTLVAEECSLQGLADAIRSAIALPEEARRSYRRRARELLEPYSRAELERRLREQVLPALGLRR